MTPLGAVKFLGHCLLTFYLAGCLLIYLTGCAQLPIQGEPAYALYPDEIDAALASREAKCDPWALQVAYATDIQAYCPNARQGCYLGTRQLALVSADYLDEDRNTMTHEAMHWIDDCQGLPGGHEDPEVWGPGGALERTNERLGLPHD